MAAHEGLHEPADALSAQTIDMHRAIVSLIEELEAVDWYQQRVDACRDPELKAILAHNRDEEKEHAAMVLEDGPAYKADFVACGRSACKAVLPLDAALASELASATKATLSLTASNGEVTNFSMGIEGIATAMAELKN